MVIFISVIKVEVFVTRSLVAHRNYKSIMYGIEKNENLTPVPIKDLLYIPE